MGEQCPACEADFEQRPSLFSMHELRCERCGVPFRTNLRSRLFFILSFGLLAAYHLYIKANGIEAQQFIVWGGLAAVLLPILLTLSAPRYETGQQKSGHSLVVNVAFYAVVLMLVWLWLKN